jgi:hypothetical protein
MPTVLEEDGQRAKGEGASLLGTAGGRGGGEKKEGEALTRSYAEPASPVQPGEQAKGCRTVRELQTAAGLDSQMGKLRPEEG